MRTQHPLSPPVLILVALEPDALCACRVFTALLKRDYIAHKIQPISGYGDLEQAGQTMVRPMRVQNGGSGGVVVCLGVGGLIDVSTVLGLDADEEGVDPSGGVAVWLIDARRPWNLGNVFGGDPVEAIKETRAGGPEVVNGQIQPTYRPGQGGVIVYDDGDIEMELEDEREAYCELYKMQEIEDYGSESGDSGDDSDGAESVEGAQNSRKRKSWSDREDDDEHGNGEGRPHQRRRSKSVCTRSRSGQQTANRRCRMAQYPLPQTMLLNVSRAPVQNPPMLRQYLRLLKDSPPYAHFATSSAANAGN